MTTWIAHLRIAENLLACIENLDPHFFAIGSVAPDSGIPDEKWENFDPPSEVTHFRIPGEISWPGSSDLAFYGRYLACANSACEHERYSFLLGYFFHLVVDNLWGEKVYHPSKMRFAAEFSVKPGFIWEVKRDWYGLDFEFIRQHPGSLFWRIFLDCQYTQDYLDFLPPHAIQRNLDYIKGFYQRTDEEVIAHYIQRPGIYLSEEEMDTFVDECTQLLMEVDCLARARKLERSGHHSALELSTYQGVSHDRH